MFYFVYQTTYHNLINTIKISLDEIWIPEMIISGEVPVGPNVDFAQMQEGQHYSMISEFIHCFIQQRKKN